MNEGKKEILEDIVCLSLIFDPGAYHSSNKIAMFGKHAMYRVHTISVSIDIPARHFSESPFAGDNLSTNEKNKLK
jgi:hypothetical protein